MNLRCKYAAMAVACLFVTAFAVFPACAASDSNSNKSAAKTKRAAPTMSDSDFAKAAAEGGLAEIRFG
jgi:hypothetical protein